MFLQTLKQINHTLIGNQALVRVIYLTVFVIILFFFSQNAFAAEIVLSPDKEVFGPNDSISILVQIEDFSGGSLTWDAIRPDGTTDSGQITSLKGGEKLHTISRNAFDNQFGEWRINYLYQGIQKTIRVQVEPLSLLIESEKKIFSPGDVASFSIKTNHFKPNAAVAETFKIEVQDKNNNPADHIDKFETKAFQANTNYQLNIEELINNNPFGEYKLVVQYFNTFSEFPFSVKPQTLTSSIFIGTDKSLYDLGDTVEIQLIVSDLIDSSANIKITNPEGKIYQKNVIITNSLTRILLDDVPTNVPGTYDVEVKFGDFIESKNFAVDFETENENDPGIDLRISLDKQQYVPGEVITAGVKTNVLLANKIDYWIVDPSGNLGPKLSKSMTSGNALIPYHIPTNAPLGPWKFYVDYGGAERFSIFFLVSDSTNEPISNNNELSQERQLLMTIEGNKVGLNKPHGIAVDSNDNIFVVNSGNSEVKKFDSNGNHLVSWGSFGSDKGQFKEPTGIFVTKNFVHVADTGNSRIQTFDKEGNFIKSWGDSGITSQSLVRPVSISQDDSGIFYIADLNLNKISKFDADGNYVGHIESLLTAAAKFASANSIATAKNNHHFIVISSDNRILEYDSENNFHRFLGSEGEDDGKFQAPSAISLDSRGYLYVGDAGNFRIQVLNPEKEFFTKWGSLGTGPGQFNNISGLALDSKGNIFVVDSANNRIQKFASLTFAKLEIPDWIRNNAKWWYEGSIGDDEFSNGIQYMLTNEIIVIPFLENPAQSEPKTEIPEWIKNNANWWSEGQISDEEFANGIEYLVKNRIIGV